MNILKYLASVTNSNKSKPMDTLNNENEYSNDERNEYLNSFNKVNFVNQKTIIIENKFIINKIDIDSSPRYTISYLNTYWKEDISIDFSVDKFELENITDNQKFNYRLVKFSLWTQNKYFGDITIKVGYEDNTHETSERLVKFLCNDILDIESYIKK